MLNETRQNYARASLAPRQFRVSFIHLTKFDSETAGLFRI